MKNVKRIMGRQGKVTSGQLAEKEEQPLRSIIEAIKAQRDRANEKMVKRKKNRLKRRRELHIPSPEFIEHDTIIKMEPKTRVRVELKIREFRKAEPPRIVEPEVLING